MPGNPRGLPGRFHTPMHTPSPVIDMQRVAIVDPSEASRESLRTLLLGVDFVWLEAE